MARIDGRTYKDLRPVEIIPGVNKFAEGSCLIRCGNTHVLCTASVEERVPPHVPYGEGWVTAEYSMLPRAAARLHIVQVAALGWTPGVLIPFVEQVKAPRLVPRSDPGHGGPALVNVAALARRFVQQPGDPGAGEQVVVHPAESMFVCVDHQLFKAVSV